MPPSGPTTSEHVTGIRAGRRRRAASVASSCSTKADAAAAHPRGEVGGRGRGGEHRSPGAAGLLGGGHEHGIPLAPGLLAALAAPLHDAARRLPRHHLVDPALGGRLDRLVVAVVLGQRLHEHEPRARLGVGRPPRPRAASSVPAPTATTSPSTRRPAPSVSSRCSPTRVRRTVAACRPSGAVEHHDVADPATRQGLGRQQVQRQGHGERRCRRSARLEGVAQLAEDRARRPGWRPAPRAAPRRAPWRAGGAAPPARRRAWWGSAPSACTTTSPRPLPRRWVTPRPRSVIESPDWVPRRTSRSRGAVEGVHRERGAQRRRGHRHLDGRVQVVAAPLERGVPVDGHLDVEVTGGPGAVPDLALAGELDAGAGVDAGRAP